MERHLTFFATDPPFTLAWEDGETASDKVKTEQVLTNPDLAQGDRFVCSQCGADITRASQRIAVGGSHRHRVPSPYGLEQEIGCFALAPGCTVLGHFAMDFGKPTDGQWQMGICSACGYHLGWHHQTEDDFGFFGLLLDRLSLAPEEPETDPA